MDIYKNSMTSYWILYKEHTDKGRSETDTYQVKVVLLAGEAGFTTVIHV